MGRMDPIDKGNGLIHAHRAEQVLVAIDESLLLGVSRPRGMASGLR